MPTSGSGNGANISALETDKMNYSEGYNIKLNLLVLELHNGLDGPVVVVEVDGADHFGAFEVTDLHRNFADRVAADKFDDLLRGGVAGVHFDGRQFDILGKTKPPFNCETDMVFII